MAARQEAVISVTLETNVRGEDLERKINITANAAQKMGEALGRALSFDNAATKQKLEEIKLLTNAVGDAAKNAKSGLNALSDFAASDTKRKLDELGKKVDEVSSKVNSLKSAFEAAFNFNEQVAVNKLDAVSLANDRLRENIRFLGQEIKAALSIDVTGLISQLKEAGNAAASISRGRGRSRNTTDGANTTIAPPETAALNEDAQMYQRMSERMSEVRARELADYNANLAAKQARTDAYLSQEQANTTAIVNILQARVRALAEFERRENERQANLSAGFGLRNIDQRIQQGAIGGYIFPSDRANFTNSANNFANRSAQANQNALANATAMQPNPQTYTQTINQIIAANNNMANSMSGNVGTIRNAFQTIQQQAQTTAQESALSFTRLFGADFFGNLAANAITGFASGLADLTKETVMYAARTEELGVALSAVAKANNMSTLELDQQEFAIKRLNITTQDTRQTLARFVAAEMDVSKASRLATVAQDLAVIAGRSTSEELNALIIAIQTLQSRNLRSAGVFITVDEVLDKLSRTTGRARDSFTTLEKQQAVLNAIMEYGSRVTGTYDAAMTTAAKQMRSMERLAAEAQNAFGGLFQGILLSGVEIASDLLVTIAKYPTVFAGLGAGVVAVTTAFIAMNTQMVFGAKSAFVSMYNAVRSVAVAMFAAKTQIYEAAIAARLQAREAAIAAGASNAQAVAAGRVAAAEAGAAAATKSYITAALGWAGVIAIIGSLVYWFYQWATAYKEYAKYSSDAVTQQQKEIEIGNTQIETLKNLQKERDNLNKKSISANLNVSELEDYRKAQARIVQDMSTLGAGGANGNQAQFLKDAADLQNAQNAAREAGIDISGRSITVQNTLNENLAKEAKILDSLNSVQQANVRLRAQEKDEKGKQIGTTRALIEEMEKERIAREKTIKLQGVAVVTNLDTALQKRADTLKNISDVNNWFDKIVADRQQYIAKEFGRGVNYDSLSDRQRSNVDNEFKTSFGNATTKSAEYAETLKTVNAEVLDAQKNLTDYAEKTKHVGETTEQAKVRIVAQAAATGQLTGGLKLFNERLSDADKALIEHAENLDSATKRANALSAAFEQMKLTPPEDITEGARFDKIVSDLKGRLNDISKEGTLNFQLPIDFVLRQNISADDKAIEEAITESVNQSVYGDQFGRKGNVHEIFQQRLDRPLTDGRTVRNLLEMRNQARQLKAELEEDITPKRPRESEAKRLKDELIKVKEDIGSFFGGKRGEMKLRFEVEDRTNFLNDLNKIAKLRHELGLPIDSPYPKGTKEAQEMVYVLELQKKKQDELLKLQHAQLDAEYELKTAREAAGLSVVDAQTRAQTTFFKQIRERRDAETQLTADIAVEIERRTAYAVDSAANIERVQAQAFLDRMKSQRAAQEELLTAFTNLQAVGGETFSFNDTIRSGQDAADGLEALSKQTDVQLLTTQRTNEILQEDIKGAIGTTNEKTEAVRSQVESLTTTLGTVSTNIIEAISNININSDSVDANGRTITASNNIYNPQNVADAGTVLRTLISMGANQNQVRAAFASGIVESGFNRQATGDNGQAFGIFQAHNGFGGLTGDARRNPEAAARAWLSVARMRGGSGAPGLIAANTENPAQENRWKYGAVLAQADKYLDFVSRQIGVSAQTTIDAVKQTNAKEKELKAEIAKTPVGPKKSAIQAELNALEEARKQHRLAVAGELQDFLRILSGRRNATLSQFTEMESKAATEVVKALDPTEAMTANLTTFYRTRFAPQIRTRERQNIIDEYNRGVVDRNFFGENRDLAKVEVSERELLQLRTRFSQAWQAQVRTNNQAEIDAQTERQKQIIKLVEDEANRDIFLTLLRRRVREEFYMGVIAQAQNTDAELAQLEQRRAFRENHPAEYRNNIFRQIDAERVKSFEDSVDAVTKARRDEDQEIWNSARFRTQVENEYYASRVEGMKSTQREIINLEKQLEDARYGMEERLRKVYLDTQLARQKATEDALASQIRSEDAITNQTTINQEVIRASVLENIAQQKSLNQSISDLFNDSFNEIAGGFDTLIDKMTGKLGGFGSVIGNFMKSATRRVLGGVFENILDNAFPRNPVLDVITGKKKTVEDPAGTDRVKMAFEELAGTTTDTAIPSILGVSQAFTDYLIPSINSAADSLNGLTYNNTPITGEYNNATSELYSQITNFGNSVEDTGDKVNNAVSGAALGINVLGNQAEKAGAGIFNATRLFGGAAALIQRIVGGLSGGGRGQGTSILQRLLGGAGNNGTTTGATPPFVPGNFFTGGQGLGSIGRAGDQFIGQGFLQSATGSTQGILQRLGMTTPGVGGLRGFFGSQVGGQLALSMPMLGASLGGMLGGPSTGASLLGMGGGLLAGGIGAAFALQGTALASSLGLTGVIGSLTAAAPFLAPVAAAALVGAYFWGRSKKRRQEEEARTKILVDSKDKLNDILRRVRSGNMSGDDAIAQAQAIRASYLEEVNKLTDKKTRNIAIATVRELDYIINNQIKPEAARAERRKTVNDALIPTYATGGIAGFANEGSTIANPQLRQFIQLTKMYHGRSKIMAMRTFLKMSPAQRTDWINRLQGGQSLIRVSQGETMIYPNGFVQNLPGAFDAKDNIYAIVPKGTVIMNPQQRSSGMIGGYAGGGVAGSVAPAPSAAQGGSGITVTPPPVIVVVVADEEMARTIVEQTPNAVIAGKTITHVKQTGTSGLAGVIGEALAGGY